MIRGIRGAEAACSVHESPFGADDSPARTVEHYNAEQLPILTILKTGINCAFNVPPRTQHLPWRAVPGRAQSKNILGVFHFS